MRWLKDKIDSARFYSGPFGWRLFKSILIDSQWLPHWLHALWNKEWHDRFYKEVMGYDENRIIYGDANENR